MTTAALRLALAVSGALSAAGLWELLRRTPTARSPLWQRANYRGLTVSLLGGPAVAGAAALGCATLAVTGADSTRRTALALLVVAVGAGAAGAYDDLRGDAGTKGLAGHLRAIAHGHLTSGAVKLAALVISGIVAAAVLGGRLSPRMPADGLLIAGMANLANLFDVRPGRTAKLTAAGLALAAAAPAAAVTPVAWCAGVSLGMLGYDVREQVMLGDAGANALGAALGVGAVVALTFPARLVALAGVVALTLLSEFVSFSTVIAATPPLRWLDGLGRADSDQRARA